MPRALAVTLFLPMALALPGCTARDKREPAEIAPVSVGKLTNGVLTSPREAKNLDALARLPASERAKVDESAVPVLVPRIGADDVHLVVEPGFYAYSGTVAKALPDGRVSLATVAIQGTRFAHEHEDFPKDVSTHDMRGTRGLFTINEGITTTTWVENGAGYSVDIECSVQGDSRCADESYVLELTQGLTFVGGRP